MVVVVEPRRAQPLRLARRQQAQRGAGLQTDLLDARDHRLDRVQIPVVGAAPGRPHAEPRRARRPGRAGGVENVLQPHQALIGDAGVEMGALRAIGAVLGTAAGLDAEQGGDLHPVGVEMTAMDRLRLEDQVVEGAREQRQRALPRPRRGLGHGRDYNVAGEIAPAGRHTRQGPQTAAPVQPGEGFGLVALALQAFSLELARAADRLRLFPRASFGRFLV